ncbi:MAG: YggS family pyridoxal phosphate-dependent enzyme [Flammeovirgaceae bacterium]|nr:YggS family pyridoxal phosphate-dependent enzyme [Flammeovirgaceae bacterium]
MSIKNNIVDLKKELPPHARLIAVSKTQSAEKVLEAYQTGHRVFGENKVQELAGKYEQLPKDIEWHLIGHLQTNKVKYVVPFVSLIHSVDSIKLLEEINKQAAKINRVVSCLLQVHIAEEETKFGFDATEVTSLLLSGKISSWKHIKIIGLMGMATFTENHDQVRKEFKSLKHLFEKLKQGTLPTQVIMQELSMGMSGDYKIALEEGSTLIRVGTAIFGERNYNIQ